MGSQCKWLTYRSVVLWMGIVVASIAVDISYANNMLRLTYEYTTCEVPSLSNTMRRPPTGSPPKTCVGYEELVPTSDHLVRLDRSRIDVTQTPLLLNVQQTQYSSNIFLIRSQPAAGSVPIESLTRIATASTAPGTIRRNTYFLYSCELRHYENTFASLITSGTAQNECENKRSHTFYLVFKTAKEHRWSPTRSHQSYWNGCRSRHPSFRQYQTEGRE